MHIQSDIDIQLAHDVSKYDIWKLQKSLHVESTIRNYVCVTVTDKNSESDSKSDSEAEAEVKTEAEAEVKVEAEEEEEKEKAEEVLWWFNIW